MILRIIFGPMHNWFHGKVLYGSRVSLQSTPLLHDFLFLTDYILKTGYINGTIKLPQVVYCVMPWNQEITCFFECPYSTEVWGAYKSNFQCIIPTSWTDFGQWGGQKLRCNRSGMIVIKLSRSLCIYCIWRERNFRMKLNAY